MLARVSLAVRRHDKAVTLAEVELSAGIEIKDEVFWVSNGGLEECLEAMADIATKQFGSNAPLTVFLRAQRRMFFTGMVVVIDECLTDAAGCTRFLEVLDAATEYVQRENYIPEWMTPVMAELRVHIAELVPPNTRCT